MPAACLTCITANACLVKPTSKPHPTHAHLASAAHLPPSPAPPARSDLRPDPNGVSCYSHFNATRKMPSFVERDGKWHHLAVTWSAKDNGLTQVRRHLK